MQDSGLIEFGSHTMSHPKLTTISPEERRRQLIESKNCLEKALGREVLAFAYPYGDGAGVAEIRADVRAAGYRYDLGIEQGISLLPWDFKAGPIKRLYVARRDGLYDFHLHLTRGAAQRFPALSRDHFREALLRRFRKLRGML
jgi:peptidoglycan/xylan/chitin deacetylase (PgdA/CDA1 family)